MAVVNQVIIMALLITVGYGCFKFNVITENVNKALSTIVLMIVNPMVIIVSYQTPFDEELLSGLLWSFLFASISFVLGIVISKLAVRGENKEQISIERISSIYSNCGFMGIPLINGIYGSQGVFYLTAYLTLFNILVWTHGVMLMDSRKGSIKMLLNALKVPAVLATALGFVLFILNISIPSILLESIEYIASMNTPMAMLVAGATIAQADLLKAIAKKRIYFITMLKLIIIPLATALVLIPFASMSDSIIISTNVIAAACPSAATGVLFSIRYKKDSVYASELFAMTTIFSMLTIPLIVHFQSVL